MSVLDLIDKKKQELKELRAADPSKYIAKMTEGFDSLKTFLDVKGEVKGQEVAEPLKNLYKSKPESLIETLVAETKKSNQQLLLIAEETTKQRKIADKNQYIKPKPASPVVVSQGGQGGGLLDLIPNAGVGGKLASASKFLGRAGGLAALAGGAFMAYDALSNDSLSSEEKSTKVGGAVGTTAGGVGGMWAGAATGAALGSVIPGIGTAVGGIVGGLIGGVGGGFLGEAVGEKVGTFMHNDLAPVVGKTMTSLASSVDKTTTSIGDRFNLLGQQVGDVFNGLAEATKPIKESFSKGWEDLSKGTLDSFSKLKEAWSSGSGFIGSIKNVVSAAPSASTNIVAGAQKAASSVGSGAISAVSIVGDAITNAQMRGSAKDNWERNGSAITEAAMRYNIDPKQFAKTSFVESAGFNEKAKAGTSSASGLFQFLDGTWVDTVAKHGAENKETAGLSDLAKYAKDNYSGKNGFNKDAARADPKLQPLFAAKDDVKMGSLMGAAFTSDNIKMLNKSGVVDPNAAEMYSAHFLGNAKLAATARTDPDMSIKEMLDKGIIRQNEIDANKSVFANKTSAKDVMSELGRRVDMGEAYGNAAQQMAQKGPVISPTNLASATNKNSIFIPGQPTTNLEKPINKQVTQVDASSSQNKNSIFIPGQPTALGKTVNKQTIPTALAEAPKSIVDLNPVSTQQTVAVSNLPKPEEAPQQQPQIVSQSSGAKPRLSEIPIHITDQGLVLIQTGII
jgi:hypothetical protein